jgi:tRNA A-37 threonylcarbamoyl transferase component Bud32
VLTDRRFGASQCVSYRYGAFKESYTFLHDGTKQLTVRTADGGEIPDDRRPEFLLPPGMLDPFAPPTEAAPDGPASFGGYTFERVIQHSNAGGSYLAHAADGTRVFIKEARAHNGYTDGGRDAKYQLREEHETLLRIHASHPGLCPAPVELFDYWENSYLVTEYIEGETLMKWMVHNTPVIMVGTKAPEYADYYRRCLTILDELSAALAALHALGYAFVDVSPKNIMIDAGDRVRFVDFEAVQPTGSPLTSAMGAPGYLPPEALDKNLLATLDPEYLDQYGMSAIALSMLFLLNNVVQRSTEVLPHIRSGLSQHAPVPAPLWERATRFHAEPRNALLPCPREVAADPIAQLRRLRDMTADRLEHMATRENPRWVFPTSPQGLRTNTRCIAHGTAGVLHALELAGRTAEPWIVGRLRDESLAQCDQTPPGLMFGNAGIAWVLAGLGESEAAERLLSAASSHPMATRYSTLGGGAAGIALAHLAFYQRTGDQRHLDAAWGLLEELPRGTALAATLGPDNATGLMHGRCGIALALYYLARLSGNDAPLAYGLQLLHEELRCSLPMGSDAIGFQVSERDNRNFPYLYAGSAGYAHVLLRYLKITDDQELSEALRQCLRACTLQFTAYAGLFQGVAGFSLVLSEATELASRPDYQAAAIKSGTALFKYAIPDATGVRYLGDGGLRFSAGLWSGSAGILLALQQVLNPRPDPLFTLDQAAEDKAVALTSLSHGTSRHLASGQVPENGKEVSKR